MRFISINLEGHLVRERPRSTAEYAAVRSNSKPTHFHLLRRCADDVPELVLGTIEGEDRAREMLDVFLLLDRDIHQALLAQLPITDYIIHALRATQPVPRA